jgi:glucosamine--fructose-6-phosphate aminotransferase (isomerizing)
MLETPALLRGFDPARVGSWAQALGKKKNILITGEGSSRIFPAHHLISLALRRGSKWRLHSEGARQAAEYELADYAVLGASNSGQTKELIELFAQLRKKGVPCYGLTATPGSRLVEVATASLTLYCGREGGVAATKSVFELALLYQALLQGEEWNDRALAADFCEEVLGRTLPRNIVDIIAGTPCLYIAGRNDGVAEELTLKANEIARKKSIYLEGTYALHGTEEVVTKDDVLLLIEPFRSEITDLQAVFSEGLGIKVVAIASFETPFPTIMLPALPGFDAYLQLLAGWNVLVAAGLATGVDIDHPTRARKVGNAV